MRFRRNPRPRDLPQILCFLTVAVLIPLGFIYEILVVLPAVHEAGGLPYIFTILLTTFILINIECNLVASMIVDTSVNFKSVSPPPTADKELLEWKNCKICDRLVPPRSWHCKLCGVCILKRDHHCAFTGYCVGHQNQRYFVCFVVYVVIGSVYAIIYNSYYMWILNKSLFNKFLFTSRTPYVLLQLYETSTVWTNLQMLVYGLNIILLIISTAILIRYTPSVWRGEAYFEKEKRTEYNNGVLGNLKSVFGQRMHFAWIFPLVESPLPEDGYHWTKAQMKISCD